MADEKTPGLAKSSPPRAPLTDYEVALALERIKLEMRANRDEQRREFDLIRADLATAKQNDERFKVLETHFGIVKWFAGIAVIAALGALFTVVAKSISVHVGDVPPSASNAERLGSDRVPQPKVPGP